ncbi:MAG: cytochrome c3 family protein [Desulfitobacteriaceae bacterium]
MKKKLVIALLGLTTMFVLGASNLALATTVDNAVYMALAPVTGDATNDNGIINANKTGLNAGINDGTTVADVIKSAGMNYKVNADGTVGANSGVASQTTQRTHGEYQNNTNSCASCHQTHTGASDNLLFKNGVYNTCTACHDGTLGFYNVFQPSTAGTFGGTVAGNASVHMANGTMEIKAAPGGNRTGKAGDGTTDLGNWTSEFTCASCHSPHGSYSSRLLNFNPNEIASLPRFDDAAGTLTGTPFKPTGGQMVRDVVYAFNSMPPASETSLAYVVVEGTATEVGVAGAVYGPNGAVLAGGDTVVVVMKNTATTTGGITTYAYLKDTSPWINGGEYNHAHSYKLDYVNFLNDSSYLTLDSVGTDPQIKAGLTYNYQKGYVKVMGASLVGKYASISRAFVVNLAMDAITYDWFGNVASGVKITKVDPSTYDNNTLVISTFCAACHTDYLTKSSDATGTTEGTGVWSLAFRHTTTTVTCLKCHFAHGSDVTVILDSQDRNIARAANELFGGPSVAATAYATEYLLDLNPSSVLKRYTNMSVCWKCHEEGTVSIVPY